MHIFAKMTKSPQKDKINKTRIHTINKKLYIHIKKRQITIKGLKQTNPHY